MISNLGISRHFDTWAVNYLPYEVLSYRPSAKLGRGGPHLLWAEFREGLLHEVLPSIRGGDLPVWVIPPYLSTWVGLIKGGPTVNSTSLGNAR